MSPRRFETGCVVEIENRFESLGAHVKLDGDIAIGPGDRVTVHGAPVVAPFGTVHSERRTATVERAGPISAFWARRVAQWRLSELYEVGFDGEPA